jgi:hypothetical protein
MGTGQMLECGQCSLKRLKVSCRPVAETKPSQDPFLDI